MLTADVDADALPAPLPQQARAVDWAALPEEPPSRPDAFVYAFEITRRDGAQQRAVLGEPVPEQLRPLVGELLSRASPQE